jgi:hypothetical protein
MKQKTQKGSQQNQPQNPGVRAVLDIHIHGCPARDQQGNDAGIVQADLAGIRGRCIRAIWIRWVLDLDVLPAERDICGGANGGREKLRQLKFRINAQTVSLVFRHYFRISPLKSRQFRCGPTSDNGDGIPTEQCSYRYGRHRRYSG